MSLIELLLVAIGLSMDAFAVSICKGLSVKEVKLKHAAAVGLYFGGFQMLMPVIGYYLGVNFQHLIERFDHWVAFGLLVLIGISMIREALGKPEELNDDFSFRTMLLLALATSIDALAVGITFAFLDTPIIEAITIIGITTMIISIIGVVVGNFFGSRYKSKAEFIGGLILVLLGLKILLEHLGILVF